MLLRYLTSLNYKNQEINKYKVMYIEQLERIIISAVGLTPIYGAVGGVRKQTHS